MAITFMVYMPFAGDLQFNAKASNFVVADMKSWNASDFLIATDADHDEIVTLQNISSGDYKFIILGANARSAVFNVKIQCCTGGSPTMNHVHNITNAPTIDVKYPRCGPTSSTAISVEEISSTNVEAETEMVRGLLTTKDVDISRNNHVIIPVYKSDVFMAAIVVTMVIVFVCAIVIGWCICMYHGRKKAKFKRSIDYIDSNVQMQSVQSILNAEESGFDGSDKCVDSVTIVHNTAQLCIRHVPQQEQEGDNSDNEVLDKITAGQSTAMHQVDSLDSDSDSDQLVQGITLGQECDVEFDKCDDCGQEKIGNIYEGDDLFYCNECWALYV
eukprot:201274_1